MPVLLFAENPKSITIGFISGGDKEMSKKGSLVVAKALQDEIGIPINVYIPKDYSTLIKALKDRKVDFAFMTAASYVAAEQDTKLQVLLKKVWAEPFYYSAILVKKKSEIKKPIDLRNKRIAFVDKKSTSGYLYPLVMLKKIGLTDKSFKKVIFSGSHSESVHLLEKDEVDAIFVFSDDKEAKMTAWTKFAKKVPVGDEIFKVWVSEPIPNDPFCVRTEYYDQYPKLAHSLMFSLIDIFEKIKSNKDVTEVIGANGFMPATNKQYDPVREMVKELGQNLN